MKKNIRSLFYYFVGKNRNTIFVRSIVKVCKVVTNAYFNNDFYETKYNGEELVVRKLSKEYKNKKITVFDVGSNIGEYTVIIQKHIPNSNIHCFEIFPSNYEQLANNANISSNNVMFNNFGLSDSTKKVKANFFPRSPRTGGINSLEWNKRNNIKKEVIMVNVMRGDEYAIKHKIDYINILKIDTEGHDFFVLGGFDTLINDGHVDVIQFEHGRAAIPSRIMLVDFYEYLNHRGYVVGRLHPGGVELKPYNPFDDEHISTGNYLAIHKTRENIIACLNIAPNA